MGYRRLFCIKLNFEMVVLVCCRSAHPRRSMLLWISFLTCCP